MAGPAVRVAVFIDWQNVYKTAREAFGMTNECGNFSPYALARLFDAGNGRGGGAQLVRVEIHRGSPSQTRDAASYAANRRQSAAWKKENPAVVFPLLRPLRYPRAYPAEPAVEKGVDVNLAVGAIEQTLTKHCDVAIIFSHDTDLLPVPEAISRLAGPQHVETASWRSDYFNQRLRPKAPVHHHSISKAVFDRVEVRVNDAHQSS